MFFFLFSIFSQLFSHSFLFPLLLLREKIGREITRVLLLLLELLSWFIFAMRTLNRAEYVTIKEMGKISKSRQIKELLANAALTIILSTLSFFAGVWNLEVIEFLRFSQDILCESARVYAWGCEWNTKNETISS